MTVPEDQVAIYIDTNVLLDYIDRARDNANSVRLVDKIRATPGLVAVISPFTLMEAVEQHQEAHHNRWLIANGHTVHDIQQMGGRNRDLSPEECARLYRDVFEAIQSFGHRLENRKPADPQIWAEATRLLQRTNIGASDAIHIAVAIGTQCKGFATRDNTVLREIRRSPRLRRLLVPLACPRRETATRFSLSIDRGIGRMRRRVRKDRTTAVPLAIKTLKPLLNSRHRIGSILSGAAESLEAPEVVAPKQATPPEDGRSKPREEA